MEQHVIVHRKSPQAPEFAQPEWPVLQTCMRSLTIVPHDRVSHIQLSDSDYIHQGRAAYILLLEIICGLHSSIKGENEVFGQFKKFKTTCEKNPHICPTILQFLDSINLDAKKIRSQFLQGLGSQSYGSFLRKTLRGFDCIDFIGAGQLVEKTLPWVSKAGSEVNVFVRDPKKYLNSENLKGDFTIQPLAGPKNVNFESALVVAAPVNAALVHQIWGRELSNYGIVVDLRGDSSLDTIQAANTVDLAQFFKEVESQKKQVMEKVQQAFDMAEQLANQRYHH